MNDHMLSDDAFLEQAIEELRRDLPDDARMGRIEQRLRPLFASEAAAHPSRWLVPGVFVAAMLMLGSIAPHRVSAGLSSRAPSRGTLSTLATERPLEEPLSAPAVLVESLPDAAATSRQATAQPSKAKPVVPVVPQGLRQREAAPPTDDPDDELALLEEARRALDTDPAAALALTDEHARRFPRPTLAQERERLAIEALVRLGRREEVLRRANAFDATFPQSAHRRRVQELVAP